MTHNNISYLEMLERKRSNLAQEAETARSNQAKESNTLFVAQLEDKAKRDIADIEVAAKRDIAAQDVETRLAIAGLSKESAAAVAQINAGASAYASRVNAETQRYIADINYEHNENELAEKTRHNIVTEDQGQTANSIASIREMHEYELAQQSLDETITHDRADESLRYGKAQADYTVGAGNIIVRLLPGLAGLLG